MQKLIFSYTDKQGNGLFSVVCHISHLILSKIVGGR